MKEFIKKVKNHGFSIVRKVKKRILLLIYGQQTYDIVSRVTWEEEYADGHWKRLEELKELPRYSVISGYLNYYLSLGFLQSSRILDAGCGHGVLQQKLSLTGYTAYTGIDISSEAIAQASVNEDKITKFIQANLMDFDTNERYDCIIFNEILVYLKSPVSVIQKYCEFLSENGLIIISQHCDKSLDILYIWDKIDAAFTPDDEIKLTHPLGNEWIIKPYKISS